MLNVDAGSAKDFDHKFIVNEVGRFGKAIAARHDGPSTSIIGMHMHADVCATTVVPPYSGPKCVAFLPSSLYKTLLYRGSI